MLRTAAPWPSGSLIALCSASPSPRGEAVALCAAVPLPGDGGGGAPEWVHLLPAGEITTVDGRGPYRVVDAASVVAASLQAAAGGAVLDENHATDRAAPRGESAPARGWIREFEARADGIWGRVEWTPHGRRLVTGRAYRAISPVINHTPDGRINAILRASLVNNPNLRGLATLHQENTMDLLAKLIAALGLPATTTEDEVAAKITAMHAAQATSATALQSAQSAALAPIATAIGLQASADQAAVLAGVQALKSGGGDGAIITALQSELATVTTRLNALTEGGKKTAAETFVDAEIRRGRVGVRPMRDRYVAMHMADPANAEALIAALPVLGGGGQIVPPTPPAREGEISLQAEEKKIFALIGVDPAKAVETMKAERAAEAAL